MGFSGLLVVQAVGSATEVVRREKRLSDGHTHSIGTRSSGGGWDGYIEGQPPRVSDSRTHGAQLQTGREPRRSRPVELSETTSLGMMSFIVCTVSRSS